MICQGLETIKLRNLINVRFFEEEFKYEYVDGVSPYYLANECFNNVFTAKTDQFNIAALLYHMMTGIPPFFEENLNFNDKNSFEAHLNNRSSNLRFPNVFDSHLKALLSKALNENSDQRFMSMSDFSNYLNRDTIMTDDTSKKVSKKPKIKLGNGFDDIAGMNSLKEQLTNKVLNVIKRPDHYKQKYGISIPNGMLLYGPPGCGKSYISEKFCEEAGFNFIMIKPSDLSSIYVSGGEEKIGELFKQAEKNAPTVICFDEVDAIMPKRTDSSHQSISARVNEFLAQINKCSERGIFIIASTNKPNLIDQAILRTGRLEIKIYVPPPDLEAREKLFNLYLKNRYCEIDIDFNKLAILTDGYVTSDIEFIVNEASHEAAYKDVRISFEILKNVIASFQPSVSKKEIELYEKDHNLFTGKGGSSIQRKPIGF